jgi:hypothetical protein
MARIYTTLADLEADLRFIAVEFKPRVAKPVAEVARDGNRTAKRFAKRSAGTHGKHYPNAMTVERHGPLSYEYGPDAAMPQGGMSFEHGSRNQPPHLDLAKSADLHGAAELSRKVDRVLDGLFWP